MSTFVGLLVFLVAMAGNFTVWVALINRTHARGWNRTLVDYLMLAFLLAAAFSAWPLALFAAGSHAPTWAPRLPAGFVTVWGWGSLAAAVLLFTHNAWVWLHPERRGGTGKVTRTPLDLNVADPLELLAEGLPRRLGALPGNQVVSPVCVEMELLVPRLPKAFEGLKITHLSDLHMSGRIDRAYYDAMVDRSNQWQPDLVVLTGDIVERPKCLDWVDSCLDRLQAHDTRLYVLGNHDHKAGPDDVRQRLTQCGFIDVGCRSLEVPLERGPCLVAGNEAPWFLPMPQVPPPEADNQTLRLALLHTPDHFAWTQQNAFHVALAGHNHGGQVRFPILGALLSPSVYGTRYTAGVFSSPTTVMHVTPGTGSLSPIRWNCAPELNLLTLRGV